MTLNKNPENIRKMFNLIADNYDRNNNIISLGTHNFIKSMSLRELSLKEGDKILDICCGTGDIPKILNSSKLNLKITGVDFSEDMLERACYKNNKGIRSGKVSFLKANAVNLPFDKNSFDAITMTFGLRNIDNRQAAIMEVFRVLKNGGEFLHLDFGRKNIFSKIFDLIVKFGMKIFYGKILPYDYLIESKEQFPVPEVLIKEFEEEGFILKKKKEFLLGIISMQIFTKI